MLKTMKEGNRKEKCLEKEIIHLFKSLILYYFKDLYFSMFNVKKIIPFSSEYKWKRWTHSMLVAKWFLSTIFRLFE